MSKYFFTQDAKSGGLITLTGDSAHHLLNVLRIKPGDEVLLCDGNEMDFHCILVEGHRTPTAVFEIKSSAPCENEPLTQITVYQAMPKGDKLEQVVQKAVEIGASEIVPVFTDRCIARLRSQKNVEKRNERLRRIAESAAGQSMRGRIPSVRPPCSFVCAAREAAGLVLFACERERERNIRAALNGRSPERISLWVGPEGGFTEGEAAFLRATGAVSVTLGRRVLRTETAAIAAIAQILCILE